LARAKHTDRTAARRRHRAEQAARLAAAEPDDGPDDAGRTKGQPARPAGSSATAARPGITTAFREAFRPVDLRGDLRALPVVVRHWGVLASVAAAVGATAVFIASTNGLGASLDFSLSEPLAGKTVDSVSNLSYLAVSLFVAPPPAAGAFLIGFTAPRASWLGGLIYGIVATICYAAIVMSPAGRLLISNNPPEAYVLNAFVIGPLGALLFASAAAWYRRFLNLANPNRGRQASKAPHGRGNLQTNSRATAGRRS
jgi:hypothetical protein